MSRRYVTTLEVILIHDTLVDEFGGADGVRDLGALEAAVFRPQSGYYSDMVAEAAALMESLLQNHPFLDGNKRTAFAGADLHLRLNGHMVMVDSAEAHEFLIEKLESGSLDVSALEEWLRDHTTELH